MEGDQTPTLVNPTASLGSAGTNQIIYPQNQLVSVKLEESNFFIWRQQILAAIRGYGLEGYITGKIE